MKKRIDGVLLLVTGALLCAGVCLAAEVKKSDPIDLKGKKIGVVLGGGGALGFAHVGVLRTLEENRVPIDYIAGTSMGSIVAGLYASGMSPDEIEAFFCNVDWWDILKDKTARRKRHFRRKRDDARYLMDVELGFKGARLTFPSGFASGQKFNNVMQTLTVNSVGAANFDELNIPYRAVATDLKRGVPVILDRGNLATAMRASMAVPGVFTPVELDGRLLVDGGIVNNIPVDVVRGMGADIIIAVDVGAWQEQAPEDLQLDTLADIVAQTYLIVQRPGQREQVASADVLIEPDLTGFSASGFHQAAPIIAKGGEAAEGKLADIRKLSVSEEQYKKFIRKQRKVKNKEIRLSSIDIEENVFVDERRIRARLSAEQGEIFDSAELETDLAYLYGFGDFQSVNYQITPEGEEHKLTVFCKEKPWGPRFIRFGLRLESDVSGNTSWSGLLNFSRRSANRLGGEIDVDIEFGTDRGVMLEWYQPLDFDGHTFVAPRLDYRNELQGLYEDGDRIADYEVETFEAGLDLGWQFGAHAELRIGPFWHGIDAEIETGDSDLPTASDGVGGVRCQFIIDRLDKVVFSRDGYLLAILGSVSPEGMGADEQFERASLGFRSFASHGDHTLITRLSGGTSFGGDLPEYAEYELGGVRSLGGLAEGQLRGDYFALASLGYRCRLGKLAPSLGEGVYLTARLDAGNTWDEGEDIEAEDLLFGGIVGLGTETVLGPISLAYGHAEGGQSRFYFSLGSIF